MNIVNTVQYLAVPIPEDFFVFNSFRSNAAVMLGKIPKFLK